MARVLCLLPARDFDPSEVAVNWRVLGDAGHVVGLPRPTGSLPWPTTSWWRGRVLIPGGQFRCCGTTALTWALERSGRSLARVTRFLDPNYYRTYPEQDGQPRGFMSVQQEVTRALARAEDFADVPATDPDYRRKTSGLHRDTIDDAKPAFVVRDRSYVSARWPGDAHTFARTFAGMLNRRVCPLCHQRSPRRTRLLVWLSVVLAAARYDGIAVTTD